MWFCPRALTTTATHDIVTYPAQHTLALYAGMTRCRSTMIATFGVPLTTPTMHAYDGTADMPRRIVQQTENTCMRRWSWRCNMPVATYLRLPLDFSIPAPVCGKATWAVIQTSIPILQKPG